MKRCMFFLALLFGFQLQMTAQKSKSDEVAPKEDIRVNREYDENGNLINENKNDSILSKTPDLAPFQQHPKAMEEMMKMLQQQLKEMEKHQKEFLKNSLNGRNSEDYTTTNLFTRKISNKLNDFCVNFAETNF